MKKSSFMSILVLTCLMVAATTMVDAQTNHRFFINIPFEFIIAGRKLPAGRYTVERLESHKPHLLIIKNTDNHTKQVFLTNRVEGGDSTQGNSVLVFRQCGLAYYLFQVWASDDKIGDQLSAVSDVNGGSDLCVHKSKVVRLSAKTKSP